MRIIFVGMHNKPGMKPLDSKTKTGKVIDRIIEKLPVMLGIAFVKTNLFDGEYFPKDKEEITNGLYRWYFIYKPTNKDINVLLGNWVHQHFVIIGARTLKLAHPASFNYRSNEQSEKYIQSAVEKIKASLTTQY